MLYPSHVICFMFAGAGQVCREGGEEGWPQEQCHDQLEQLEHCPGNTAGVYSAVCVVGCME